MLKQPQVIGKEIQFGLGAVAVSVRSPEWRRAENRKHQDVIELNRPA